VSAAAPLPRPRARSAGRRASSTTTIAPWPSARLRRARSASAPSPGSLADELVPRAAPRVLEIAPLNPYVFGASCASAAGATRGSTGGGYREGSDPRRLRRLDRPRPRNSATCAPAHRRVRAADPPARAGGGADPRARSTRSRGSSSRAARAPGDSLESRRGPDGRQGARPLRQPLDHGRDVVDELRMRFAGVERRSWPRALTAGRSSCADHAGERDRPVSSYDGRLEQAARRIRRLGLGPVATRRAAGRRGRRRRRGACRWAVRTSTTTRWSARRSATARSAFRVVLPADLADGAEHRIAVRVAASDYVAPPVLSFSRHGGPGSPWATTVFPRSAPRRWPSQICGTSAWRSLLRAAARPSPPTAACASIPSPLEIRGDRFHSTWARSCGWSGASRGRRR